ncbi:MAG: hypothetical protein ABS85_01435 [Sphingobacteriales bacterium SCN 48-20]|uniref:hypothetical protein n=1 Tax=Terrimonas ferruginea TaxID=249 RepID=UPI000869397D|nr:hypothetical protein [Terrimonas ferruginea]MBN8783330.1 hypothetical protein [Terrimonas ferruginea]ODT95164.1 MAG: hypothetical protein ABS85_01435 [Sphingobacteriales bacterium SCN 48-20]OJW39946.1 MAG: hypothetical protein BGO56_03530 [Sphingobacteriales bacterium 48-107]
MIPKLYTFLLLVLFSLAACQSAEKLYSRGQYDQAVEAASKKLSKKPNDAKLRELVQNAYRYAVEDHEGRVRQLSGSTSTLRWEQIYGEYQDLQKLYNAIRRNPAIFELVQPTDYSSYITTYKEQASNAREDRGDQLMEQQTKKSARDAYYEFQQALALKPGDLTLRQKMDEALAMAMTNVVVNPVSRSGYAYGTPAFGFQNFEYDIQRYLNTNNRGNFVDFYTYTDARARNVRPDLSVELWSGTPDIGRYRDQRSTREVSKQIVSKEIVHKPDSITKEYITVKARITVTTRTLRADGLLQAVVRDIENRTLWSDTYRGEYNWIVRFASFTGDERALSDEDRKLVAQREEWPPANSAIANIITNEILSKAQCGISDYFHRIF